MFCEVRFVIELKLRRSAKRLFQDSFAEGKPQDVLYVASTSAHRIIVVWLDGRLGRLVQSHASAGRGGGGARAPRDEPARHAALRLVPGRGEAQP